MGRLGILLIILAISNHVQCWLVDIHLCSRDEDCGYCSSEGRCIWHFLGKHCECTENHNQPTTRISTVTTTTTTTTTTQPLVPLDCNNQKISVIESIAENLHVEDKRVGACLGTNKHQTSEALVINKCNATARSFWTHGPKTVKELCSEGTIAAYTPISTFYSNEINTAGFFIKCLEDKGLEIAFQTCQEAPKITLLNETTSPRASDFYQIYILP